MQLFKRVLLSLFPDEIVAQTINPASMFISFISAKEFFSVINRKIVENYKLNLFDATVDPFEFKIGFGDKLQHKPKDTDTYYSYCAMANLNGYRFFSPANIGNNLALVVALYVKDIFRAYPSEYYLNFLYTIFLLGFVFLARIKIFPYDNREKNYNRFIEVVFSFYQFVFQQTGKKADPKIIAAIKKSLLNQMELFFLLFSVYKHFTTIFSNPKTEDKDIYTRLFYDEIKNDNKNAYQEFISHHKDLSKDANFGSIESKILQSILPADILLRYIFLDADMFLITNTIISKVFDKKILDGFLTSFRKDESQLEAFLMYISDYKNFKKNFFSGVQKYMVTSFRNEDVGGGYKDDFDDLMSSIGEDIENIESFKIPERIKKESKMMEKILNFYITLVGGSRLSRGDSFFLRLFRPGLISDIEQAYEAKKEKNYTLLYYGSLLYQYGKNVFFYKHTSENVRAGKQKFTLPLSTNIKNIYSNISLLTLFNESAISVLLQDINPKDIRLYVKNKKILELFKGLIGTEITQMVKGSDSDFIQMVYQELSNVLSDHSFSTIIHSHTTEQDIYHLKEHIYNLDFWIWKKWLKSLLDTNIQLKTDYSDLVIMGITATARETLFGLLMYLTYLNDEAYLKNISIETMPIVETYIQHILHLDEQYNKKCAHSILNLQKDFNEILKHWIQIDDNKDYLKIAYDNRMSFSKNKKTAEIKKNIISEDALRFKGFLKNITYYNKRFLMPQ